MLMERFADAGAALAEGLRLAPDGAGLQAAMARLRRDWPEAAGPAPAPPAAAAGADWGGAAKRCGLHGARAMSYRMCCESFRSLHQPSMPATSLSTCTVVLTCL